jgi:hypothetical protein
VSEIARLLDRYLEVRRALGYKLLAEGRMLRQFTACLEENGHDHITTVAALAWATAPRDGAACRHASRLSAVRAFARFAAGSDPRTEIPPVKLLAGASSHRLIPRIFTEEEIQALVTAARALAAFPGQPGRGREQRLADRPLPVAHVRGIAAAAGTAAGPARAAPAPRRGGLVSAAGLDSSGRSTVQRHARLLASRWIRHPCDYQEPLLSQPRHAARPAKRSPNVTAYALLPGFQAGSELAPAGSDKRIPRRAGHGPHHGPALLGDHRSSPARLASSQRDDPAAALLPRICATCGGPYRSDLDDACPHCHTARPDTQAGWRLDHTDLTLDTEPG